MIRRPCLACGVLTTGESRCVRCEAAHDAVHRRYKAERYNATYRRLRAVWAPRVAAGGVLCSRCCLPLPPADGWDLDHHPERGLWPAHPVCNRGAG